MHNTFCADIHWIEYVKNGNFAVLRFKQPVELVIKWFDYRKGAKSAKKNKNLRFSYFVINTHRPKISGKTAKEQNIAVFRIVLKQSLVRKRPKNQK